VTGFACPSDCAKCCRLQPERTPEAAAEERAFIDAMAEMGVYTCEDGPNGLVVSPPEAARLKAVAKSRGLRLKLHPRTFLLDARARRVVVVAWHLAHAPCTFLDGFRCTVYDDRPLVCRAFPVSSPAPWRLAPLCPEGPPARAKQRTGLASFPVYFGGEAAARRALDAEDAAREARALALLDDPRARFRAGLSFAAARKLGARWPRVDVLDYAPGGRARARSA